MTCSLLNQVVLYILDKIQAGSKV